MLETEIFLAIVGFSVGYGALLYTLYKRTISLKAKPVIRFFEELEKQIDLGVLANLQDVLRIQRSVADEMRSQALRRRDVKGLLESYLLRVSRSDKDAQAVHNRFEFVKGLLDQEPLAILPDREQAILQRLRHNILGAQKDDALRHLDELITSIGARYQALDEQLGRTRIWTVIGAVGAILGVFVGLIAWVVL